LRRLVDKPFSVGLAGGEDHQHAEADDLFLAELRAVDLGRGELRSDRRRGDALRDQGRR
jgi:hypothetical protein